MQTLTSCWNSAVEASRAACSWSVWPARYGFWSTTAQRAVSFATWFASIQ